MGVQINRRTFLKEAVCATSALALAGQAAGMVKVAGAAEDEGAQAIEISETLDCDVVVVGAGFAGLVAAFDGAQQSLDVVLLEKNGFTGGTSMMAEGMFGCGSRMQLELGIEDDAEHYFKAAMEYHHWANNAHLTRRIYEGAADTVNWLIDNGMEFRELDTTFSPVPTWHVYKTRGSHVAFLDGAVRDAGVRVLTSTPAKQLLTNDEGAAVGVTAVDEAGKGIQINAKAVVMATGGYANNREMLDAYSPYRILPAEEESEEKDIHSYCGVPGRDGDGILMGMAAGADTFHLGAVMPNCSEIYGPAVPEEHILRNMIGYIPMVQVNQSGRRFTDENLPARDFVALCETIAHYNEMCEADEDTEFYKDSAYMIPIKTPPFYAARVVTGLLATIGGLRIDERMRVLDPDQNVIKGLYALGGDAGGMYGHMYDVAVASGAQQGFCAIGARYAIQDIVESLS